MLSIPPHWRRGSELSAADQRIALARFMDRYTGDHEPGWVRDERQKKREYAVQYASDAEWLATVRFRVDESGNLDVDFPYIIGKPTFPGRLDLQPKTPKPVEIDQSIAEML